MNILIFSAFYSFGYWVGYWSKKIGNEEEDWFMSRIVPPATVLLFCIGLLIK